MKAKLVAVLLVASALAWLGVAQNRKPDSFAARGDSIPIRELLAGAGDGFRRVTAAQRLHFPADHGAHPEYRSEWWYLTGHLRTRQGRPFGFQLTFFRFALSARPPVRQSDWASNDVYMAHFAVTDVTGGGFHRFERFSRAALGLAGAHDLPFQVWLDDWNVQSEGEDFLPLRVSAASAQVSLALTVSAGKPRVAQGEAGFSQKSAGVGNATQYYSYTRLPASGVVSLSDVTHEVTGSVWLDREWGTSALADNQLGWDWFALQLDDGREIMYYQLRTEDGGIDEHSAGVMVGVDGNVVKLGATDVLTEPLDFWSSPSNATRYPIRWRMSIPKHGLSAEISAYLPNQEHDQSIRYWEGAARVQGVQNGRPISGQAYVEITSKE